MSALAPGRRHAGERMDDEPVGYEDFRGCLVDLARLNRLSLGYRPTLAFLAAMAKGRDRLSVLDVGSGYGDGLRAMARAARRLGIAFDGVGLDLNPHATRAAREATPADLGIRFETGDVFAVDPGRRFDCVTSALFAHHLADEALVRFVRWMDGAARVGWFVNDLHRHAVPFHALRLGLAAAPVHRFVRHDGPVSVGRAFVRADWTALLAAAGVAPERASVRWWAPFRWGVMGRPEGAS